MVTGGRLPRMRFQRVVLCLGWWFGSMLAAQDPPAAESPRTSAAEPDPYPVLVTDRTRADPAELVRLTKPGKVVFADGFESDASFCSYFEIGGQKEGRVRIAREPELVHGGSGSLELLSSHSDGRSCGASPVLGGLGMD